MELNTWNFLRVALFPPEAFATVCVKARCCAPLNVPSFITVDNIPNMLRVYLERTRLGTEHTIGQKMGMKQVGRVVWWLWW